MLVWIRLESKEESGWATIASHLPPPHPSDSELPESHGLWSRSGSAHQSLCSSQDPLDTPEREEKEGSQRSLDKLKN